MEILKRIASRINQNQGGYSYNTWFNYTEYSDRENKGYTASVKAQDYWEKEIVKNSAIHSMMDSTIELDQDLVLIPSKVDGIPVLKIKLFDQTILSDLESSNEYFEYKNCCLTLNSILGYSNSHASPKQAFLSEYNKKVERYFNEKIKRTEKKIIEIAPPAPSRTSTTLQGKIKAKAKKFKRDVNELSNASSTYFALNQKIKSLFTEKELRMLQF